MKDIIQIQTEFDQKIPSVYGNIDYSNYREQLEVIDGIIRKTGIENKLFIYTLEKNTARTGKRLSAYQKQKLYWKSIQALRFSLIRRIEGVSLRKMAVRLADSALLQWFCRINRFDEVQVPSKSKLHDYEKMYPEKVIRQTAEEINRIISTQGQKIGLEENLDLRKCYTDSTCVKAWIHYPVDWVLLRDAVKTMMQAVILIREKGLKNRMQNGPEVFIRKMNNLGIRMSRCRRTPDAKKKRKKILRLMKKVVKTVEKHAARHRDLLESEREKSGFTEKQAAGIIKRIDSVVEVLPLAVKQAHERIIGGRRVANKEKILSLYEPDIHVIKRGKAGAEVEFGNKLLLAEQEEGIILDWKLYREHAKNDTRLLKESLNRIEKSTGIRPELVSTDRGFSSPANHRHLEEMGIYDAICPKGVEAFERKQQEPEFTQAQKRRGQTEGRISIMKHCFFGETIKRRGFENRKLHVGWAVLSHNLWCVAGIIIKQRKENRAGQKHRKTG